MKFKKKHAAIAVIILFIIVNCITILRLMFSVIYPERVLKEVVAEYFKSNLNKAVKFEDLYIDYDGTIVISDFNLSITSDFNDNISLIKSKKALVNLCFFRLFSGTITVEGIDFHNSEITFVKKYGRSHLDALLQVFDPDSFVKKTQKNYENFYIDFHRAKLFYRESLKAKQITLELDKIDAEMNFDKNNFSYAVSGRIKPYQSDVIRKGSFNCSGAVNIRNFESYSHRIVVDNFDLTYLNEHMLDYKLADLALKGGISADVKMIKSRKVIYLKGQLETASLTMISRGGKFNIVSNENLNAGIDMTVNTVQNHYAVKQFKVTDDAVEFESSGNYARNNVEDSVAVKFKTNSIDLADLSQNITPLKDIEYGGTFQCEGDFFLDFKNKKAPLMKAKATLDGFNLSRNEKGTLMPVIEETMLRLSLDEKSIAIDLSGKPLKSDLVIKSRTDVAGWIPFKSDSTVTVRSKKMNLVNLKHAVIYLADRIYASAYKDKRNVVDRPPFLQRPIGKFLNYNNINLACGFGTVFYGKKSRLGNVSFGAQLNRGTMLLNDFKAEGYDAKYRLSFQGYFNSDQPYVKLEGKIDDFDLGGFYADSGLNGTLTAKANTDLSYEVSAARIGDILDNAKGHFNIYVGRGEMKRTPAQLAIMNFLRKNGYEPDSLSSINFDSITLSLAGQGENFWFSNFGVRGDTMLFSAVGDYLYEAGINSSFNVIIRKDAASINVPVRLSGPVLYPCIDVLGRQNSHKECF